MSDKPDVVIIGAGAIGICTAYYLAQGGCRVTVVDKGEVGSGCSYANAGLIVPSHFVPLAAPGIIGKGLKWMLDSTSPFYIKPRLDWDLLRWLWHFRAACSEQRTQRSTPILHRLCQMSSALFDELAAQNGAGFWYDKKGVLMLYRSEQEFEADRQVASLATELGINVRVLQDDQIRKLAPELATSVRRAIHYVQDAHLDPALFVRGMRSLVETMGVNIKPSTEVKKLQHDGGRITHLITSQGELDATEFVLAGGSWSAEITTGLALNLPLQPAKGYSITAKVNGALPSLPLLLAEAKVVVTPLRDRLRFAGTLELAGMDLSINRRRVDAILNTVPEYLPQYSSTTPPHAEIWGGLRPCTPDGLPYIGRFRNYSNLIAATGHAMLGITLAPATGRLISELILAQQPAMPLEAFSPERFN